MDGKPNDYITSYKELLKKNELQATYEYLIKYILKIKSDFAKKVGDEFTFGNASQGYLDYTYFPFFNIFLRENKLRFGIVLNHREVRFELWLMGQNTRVQKEFWYILKDTEWNKDMKTMPKYSVLEAILVQNPDFSNLDILTQEIEDRALYLVKDIIDFLNKTKA